MATHSQIAANRENSLSSTGPQTETGKQHSSRNAVTHGLFTLCDFVRPEEQPEYDRFCAAFQSDLNPTGALEETFVMTIIGASWRLRRCALVESDMSGIFSLDPMEDQAASRIQGSVDRARSQAFRILRQSTGELRRLQTERAIRNQNPSALDESSLERSSLPGLASYRDVARAINASTQSDSSRLASNCIHSVATPRSAACPCGSGAKFKRCCGKTAPPVLQTAA